MGFYCPKPNKYKFFVLGGGRDQTNFQSDNSNLT